MNTDSINISLKEASFDQIMDELKDRSDVLIVGAMFNDSDDWTIQSHGRQIELIGLVELIKTRTNLVKNNLIDLLLEEEEEED